MARFMLMVELAASLTGSSHNLLVDTFGYLWMASGINPKMAMGGRFGNRHLV